MNVGIVGAGIFGLAGALELRARGHQVTLFERGTVPDERAASTDVAKTIRRLYGDDETYVELAERAALGWKRWHQRLGRAFYFQSGQLEIVRRFEPGCRLYDSWQFLARRGADVRVLSPAEARARYPQFAYRPDDVCIHDPWGGYLTSALAMETLAGLARDDGIALREQTPVRQVEEGPAGVRVAIAAGDLQFDRVIVATGVWLAALVPAVGRHLRITRQQMAFFEPADVGPFMPGVMPAWGVEPDEEGWYGHPLLREGVVKVAIDREGELVDPDADRRPTPAFLAAARAFVAERIPALATATLVGGRSCFYDLTPDHHFIVDWAPGWQRLLVAGGGSGHGFKFGGSIGPIIADALEGKANPLGDQFRIGSRFDA